jgi:hypothetical protein
LHARTPVPGSVLGSTTTSATRVSTHQFSSSRRRPRWQASSSTNKVGLAGLGVFVRVPESVR